MVDLEESIILLRVEGGCVDLEGKYHFIKSGWRVVDLEESIIFN